MFGIIFNKTKDNNHFMGGKKVQEQQIFLFGQIRAGRSSKIKKKLILELRDIIIKKTKIDISQVWVYIVDLSPSQMIEYGAILPESGQERKWFNSLSPKLKKKLSLVSFSIHLGSGY